MRQQATHKHAGRPTEIRGATCIQTINFNADRFQELLTYYPKASASQIMRDLVEKELEWLAKKNPDGSDRTLPIGDVYKHEGPKQTTLEDYFHQPDRFVEDCFSKVNTERDRLVLIKQFNRAVMSESNRRRHELSHIRSWSP